MHTIKQGVQRDLVGAYNILVDGKPITLSPPSRGIGVMGRRSGPRLNRGKSRDVTPNLPALTGGGTLALYSSSKLFSAGQYYKVYANHAHDPTI